MKLAVVALVLATGWAQAQDLGEAARQNREAKRSKAKVVVTDEESRGFQRGPSCGAPPASLLAMLSSGDPSAARLLEYPFMPMKHTSDAAGYSLAPLVPENEARQWLKAHPELEKADLSALLRSNEDVPEVVRATVDQIVRREARELGPVRDMLTDRVELAKVMDELRDQIERDATKKLSEGLNYAVEKETSRRADPNQQNDTAQAAINLYAICVNKHLIHWQKEVVIPAVVSFLARSSKPND